MKTYRLNTGLLAGAALVLVAAAPLNKPLTFQPDSRIWVAGSSSVKDFKCEAATIDERVVATSAATAGLDLADLVGSAEVAIAVAKLDCGNGTMNDHMRKALKTADNPTISFRMSSYQITDGDKVAVKGNLRIAGQDRPVELRGTVTETAGTIATTATAQIDMTQWGVKPPSLMMGTMKVKPLATIGFDVSFKR